MQAQDSSLARQHKISFSSVTQIGLLEGQAGLAFQVQTVNGIAVGPWQLGLGTGIDKYGVRSVPVFVQAQYGLPVLDRSFSVYLDGGRSFTWPEQSLQRAYATEQNGWYWDAGLQYQFKGKRAAGPVFSLGYSGKTYGWEENMDVQCVRAPCPGYHTAYKYIYRRISLKAGIKL
ncbi:hypothetical protein BUE76_14450 [Cnuella takakiae]|nr:hypothetical protein BUE76_14450 [Cnuella takakiae]